MKCKNCGLIFLDPKTPMPKYGKDYFKNYSGGKKSYLKKQESKALSSKHFLDLLEAYLDPKYQDVKKYLPNLLEIGSAVGFFLKEASSMGWIAEGVEISDWARNYSNEKLGFKTYKQIPKKKKYDAVVMLNTIEHLQDPKSALNQIYILLNKNGLLLITTPNFRLPKPSYVCPEHRFYFNIKTIERLLQDTGFRIVHFRCPYLTRKIDSKIKNVKIKKKLIKNPITKLVYKTIKKFDNTRFGSTIEIIAKKGMIEIN